jgi:prefoldin subunit 5
MLRIQLGAFEQVIHRLQDELDRRAKSEAETIKTIELLSREIEKLRHQLQSHPESQSEATSQGGQRID